MFYFAVDGSGKLAWDRDSIDYFDVNAHVVALISGAVPDAYKAFLRAQGVSYLIVGHDQLDRHAPGKRRIRGNPFCTAAFRE